MSKKQPFRERLLKLINRNAAKLVPPRQAFPNSKHVIKPAFKSGNIWYYEFDDVFNLPYQRGLQAIHAYEELRMKCDREYLLQHTELIDELLSKTITLDEISRIKAANNQLKERLNWIVIPDQAYKLASIVFFDANEDPINYDFKYAEEKIERWKQNEDVSSFFFASASEQIDAVLRRIRWEFSALFETRGGGKSQSLEKSLFEIFSTSRKDEYRNIIDLICEGDERFVYLLDDWSIFDYFFHLNEIVIRPTDKRNIMHRGGKDNTRMGGGSKRIKTRS